MMTPRQRREFFARAGLAEPIPHVTVRRSWEWIDDRVVPEGEADGEFTSFVQWVNKASSWIGFTGAKCYDAKDRRCRNGAAFQLAHDEDAFPVRWYLPERFPEPRPVDPRVLRIRFAVARAAEAGATIEDIRNAEGLRRAKRSEIEAAMKDRALFADDRWTMTSEGMAETAFEASCARRAASVQK